MPTPHQGINEHKTFLTALHGFLYCSSQQKRRAVFVAIQIGKKQTERVQNIYGIWSGSRVLNITMGTGQSRSNLDLIIRWYHSTKGIEMQPNTLKKRNATQRNAMKRNKMQCNRMKRNKMQRNTMQ